MNVFACNSAVGRQVFNEIIILWCLKKPIGNNAVLYTDIDMEYHYENNNNKKKKTVNLFVQKMTIITNFWQIEKNQ